VSDGGGSAGRGGGGDAGAPTSLAERAKPWLMVAARGGGAGRDHAGGEAGGGALAEGELWGAALAGAALETPGPDEAGVLATGAPATVPSPP